MKRIVSHTKRIVIGIVGTVVVLVGIVLIPYPGPGWLTVFAGLAILATEFSVAERILVSARRRYEQWVEWLARQSWWVRALTLLFTGVVVIVSVWLVNGFGILGGVLGFRQEWLISPFLK